MMTEIEKLLINLFGQAGYMINSEGAEAVKETAAQIQDLITGAEEATASKIFNLAHKYAQEDKTMIGSEELRAYHYYNAIHIIGKFEGR